MLLRKKKINFYNSNTHYELEHKKYSYNLPLIKKNFYFFNWMQYKNKPQLILKIKPVLNNLYLSIIFNYKTKTKLIKHYNISTLDFFKNKSLINSFFLLELLKLLKNILVFFPLNKLNLIIELMHKSLTSKFIQTILSFFKPFKNFYLKLNSLTPFNGCRLKKLRRKKVVIYYI